MASKKKVSIRKGSVKRFEDPAPRGIPTDRDTKVLAYDDERVIMSWQTEQQVYGKGTQPVTRTASVTRKVWET